MSGGLVSGHQAAGGLLCTDCTASHATGTMLSGGFVCTPCVERRRAAAAVAPDTTVLDEAKALVYGDRAASYGSSRRNHKRIALMWSALFDYDVSATDVALAMACVKIARMAKDSGEADHSGDVQAALRDSLVDLAGYAAVVEQIWTRR